VKIVSQMNQLAKAPLAESVAMEFQASHICEHKNAGGVQLRFRCQQVRPGWTSPSIFAVGEDTVDKHDHGVRVALADAVQAEAFELSQNSASFDVDKLIAAQCANLTDPKIADQNNSIEFGTPSKRARALKGVLDHRTPLPRSTVARASTWSTPRAILSRSPLGHTEIVWPGHAVRAARSDGATLEPGFDRAFCGNQSTARARPNRCELLPGFQQFSRSARQRRLSALLQDLFPALFAGTAGDGRAGPIFSAADVHGCQQDVVDFVRPLRSASGHVQLLRAGAKVQRD
jgi:hypothetical protein